MPSRPWWSGALDSARHPWLTYYAARVITSFLFQTAPHDPLTLVSVVALLAAAACLAAWLPARRAAAIDPVAALRAD